MERKDTFDFTIQLAKPSHLDGLVEIENECFVTDQISRRSYRDLLKKHSAKILIAVHKEKMIGCVVVLFRRNSKIARCYSLAVSKAYQGNKVASALNQALEDASRKRGCDAVILEVNSSNASAIRFYEKNNYKAFGVYKNFYEDGSDAIRMKKEL